ncbi:sigma 54-interacting transcriptional regulator, partial [Bacillus sp. JJ722]|uniref:sigma 54-interacting transcriptional regulator n=1 Tax=Bacillus sp. JJ722 TaxID=3122973 RepID=UPI002FFF263A
MYSKVKDMMNKIFITFYEYDAIMPTIKIFLNEKLDAAPVFNDLKELVGIVTENELLRGISDHKQFLKDIMTEIKQCVYEHDEINNIIHIKQDVFPVMNDQNNLVGILSRKKLLEVYASEVNVDLSQLDAIFKSAHNGIVSIDQRGFITSLNPAAERMAGTRKEVAIGRFLSDVVSPKGLLDVLRNGKTTSEKYQVGNRKYISNRTPIMKNNEIIGAVGVFQDISEIEYIYDELQSVKKLLAQQDIVIESSRDGILILDRFGKIIKSNQALNDMFGLKKMPEYYQELLGEHMSQCILTLVLEKENKVSIIEQDYKNQNQLLITAIPVNEKKNEEDFRVVVTIHNLSEIDQLRAEIKHTKQHLKKLLEKKKQTHNLIAHSSAMRETLSHSEQIANVDSTVLLLGESGVGKSEISNFIHQNSNRKLQPFITVNCGAILESLVDSELFGYEGGAFTGANKGGKVGYFERAHGGTIFLDEVGELPLTIQVKLLRVLQEKEIIRVGGSKPIKVDVRVITATNKDLSKLVEEKKFREDLFYRLNVIPIHIPPLRERGDDIPFLIKQFQENFCFKYGLNKVFSDEAVQAMTHYHWPGNVRELVNMVERLLVTLNIPVINKED